MEDKQEDKDEQDNGQFYEMQMDLSQTLKKGASISDMLYSGEDDA